MATFAFCTCFRIGIFPFRNVVECVMVSLSLQEVSLAHITFIRGVTTQVFHYKILLTFPPVYKASHVRVYPATQDTLLA